MALWFPLMINAKQIGEVEVVRRADDMTEAGEYTYDWTVSRFSRGLTKTVPKVSSGELTHIYDDGAFELVRKVLAAYGELP